MTQSPVFYYPVQLDGDPDTLIYYAYETETAHGVTMLYDATTLDATAFADAAEAAECCRALNAREKALPRYLPPAALRFLFACARRPRYHDQHGRRFLVLSLLAPTEVRHAS